MQYAAAVVHYYERRRVLVRPVSRAMTSLLLGEFVSQARSLT